MPGGDAAQTSGFVFARDATTVDKLHAVLAIRGSGISDPTKSDPRRREGMILSFLDRLLRRAQSGISTDGQQIRSRLSQP
ncbi:unnamed protein product [Vitrella brassicaformis CCMP3155]|uniref:Uncharacterized protein n=1 Tax=Vitrella brassicaformis (strain CCMP3155) TaxID=1169540 RepID=A0A0G4EYW7_VITBC|nr:unnamed protein product [Vitrella brassicaformis CCMP3155]|mmetsp:Transcript_30881/g.76635  ORF Transcript_30881/g.76635 Transcript_30881/m.76635 type:complete len:80 (-) Transcript_30881:10-249(-)|eukprot:CEM03694.1 unnamed protein product [Vitrella brassicaformis CCMP3155]